MKILQLVTKRQFRGAEVFAANLSEDLIKLGHQIIFVGLYRNEADELIVDNAENLDLIGAKKGNFSGALVKKLVHIIRTKKPDIVQCNGSDTLKYMVAASLVLPEVPILYRNISIISEWVNSYPKKILYKKLFHNVNHVSSVGQEAIDDFVETFNYPIKKTSVIRRGIPIKPLGNNSKYKTLLRKDLGLKETDKIAIHIGNFSPEKNHQFLLELFSEIKDDNEHIKLVCVGNGILFDSIEREIKQRQLKQTVFLLGFRKDIPELLAGADCFVLSSKVEGVPGVILEAGSQNIPSISTNVGGVSEVLRNGETGYIVENFDLIEFKNKLIWLMKEETERKRLGRNAFELVSKEFNPEINARKFEDLYYSLTDIKRDPKNRLDQLRILQIIQKNQFRGAEVFCNQISNHFQNLDQKVEIINLFEGNATLPFKGRKIGLNRPQRLRYLDFEGWKKISDHILEFKPDIIQANASDTLKYTVLAKLIFRWKIPIVYRNASTPSFYIKSFFSKRFNAFLLRNVDFIVSVSNASKKDLNNLFPFTASKNVVIPVGLEEREVPHSATINGKMNLLHIGSFTNEKNHTGLLRIFEKVVQWNPEVKLYLLGDGPLKVLFQKKVQIQNLDENVTFLSGTKDPLPLIKSSQALLLPSATEGMPGVLLEAMYVKTPVIAYNVGGISEIVTEENGNLVSVGDEAAFVRAIKKCLQEPDQEKIERAHQMVIQEYMNSELAQRFLKVYREVLGA